jgi:hypothetical protein
MRPFILAPTLVAAALLAGSVPLHAQDHGVPIVTRLVKVFLDQETQLQQAERNADEVALGRLLADDFEERDAAQPGVPVARADWLVRVQRERRPAGHIEQMAVHDHGCVSVVSYLLRQEKAAPRFIVDTWVRQGDQWRLKVRYTAPAGGAPAATPATDAQPSGKG